jgi:hypothetical protein
MKQIVALIGLGLISCLSAGNWHPQHDIISRSFL